MSSLTRNLKKATRRASRPLARYVPAGSRLGRTTLMAQARASHAITVGKQNGQAGLRVADEVIADRPDLPHGWKAAVSISKAMKDQEAALDYAARGTDAGAADGQLLLEYRKLAVALRDEQAGDRALAALVARPPKSDKQLAHVARALRFAPLEVAVQFRARLADRPLDLTALDETIAELEVMAAAAPATAEHVPAADALEVARRVSAQRPGGLRIAVTALQRRHAWPELLTLLAESSPDGEPRRDPGLPTALLAKGAARAAADGWMDDAAVLARWVLAQGDDPAMRRILDEDDEQRRIRAEGWPVPPRAAEPAYDPAPRSVLSLLGQSLPIRSGGYATRSHGILTGVAARGWTVRAATRYGFPYDLWWSADDERQVAPVDVVDGVPYHRLLDDGVRDYPRFPLVDYVEAGATRVEALAKAHRPSLVHASSLYDVGLTGLTAARRLGVPFVYELRGLKQLLEEARLPRFRETDLSAYLDEVEVTAAREADAVFVITEALGHEMVRLGVPEDRIVVVPNGVHADRFTPRDRDADLERALGVEGKTVIGYAGGFVGYEGLELLLTAVAALKEELDGFHVVLVGDGARDRALRRLTRTLGIDDVVTFTGRVGHDVVDRYLSLFDITPFPRLPLPVCELISPIKPFEAMAMGKAVVVSDVEALTEIVKDGDTGRSFAKGDADDLRRVLRELIEDPGQRERLGRRAREWVVAERDWAAITGTVAAAYERVLAAR